MSSNISTDTPSLEATWRAERAEEKKPKPRKESLTAESQDPCLNELHPFSQVLSIRELEDCMKVEEAFSPSERGSREKVSTLFPLLDSATN